MQEGFHFSSVPHEKQRTALLAEGESVRVQGTDAANLPTWLHKWRKWESEHSWQEEEQGC